MNLGDLFSTIARRWPLSLLGLLIAAGGAFGVYSAMGPQYETKASVALMPPASVVSQQATQDRLPNNPLLYLGNLTNTRDVVIASMSGKDVTSAWSKKYPNATITLAADQTSGSPLIDIDVVDSTQSSATQAMSTVLAAIPSTLVSLQTQLDVPEANRITSLQVTSNATPTVVRKKQIEFTGLAFVGLLALSLLAIGLVDGARRRRAALTADAPATRVTTGTRAPATEVAPATAKAQRSTRKGATRPVVVEDATGSR